MQNLTYKKTTIGLLVFLLVLTFLALAQPAAAGGLTQAVYQTPTPGTDGRILYMVKSGDTCLSISLLTGVVLEKLRSLNNLKADCTIVPGQKLLLGYGGPVDATPTPGPSSTPTTFLPSPTPQKGIGEVCIALFNDVNGNALRETGEDILGEGAVSVTDQGGKVSLTGNTVAGVDPLCFKDVQEGEYNVSVAVPNGYNPTTVMNYQLVVRAGDQAVLDLGAQVSSKAAPVPPSEGGRSPLLGIIGAVLLLGGAGLGIFIWLRRK